MFFLFDAQANNKEEESGFVSDFTSFYRDEDSKKILAYGSLGVAFLLATKEATVDKVQNDLSKHKPFGEYSKYGDYMGQLVPNIIYLSSMYIHGRITSSAKSYERAMLMVKTTFYAGLTTNILKYTIREKRPNGGDNLSFPSGHSATAFSFASVVALEHGAFYGSMAYALASFVGASRINDNMHHLHDVVAGATIGMAYGYAFHNKNKEKQNLTLVPMPLDDGAYLSMYYFY